MARITVNGQVHEVEHGRVLSYDDVVKLAGEWGTPSVTYRGVYERPHQGILEPGDRITAQFGLVFNIAHTGNA